MLTALAGPLRQRSSTVIIQEQCSSQKSNNILESGLFWRFLYLQASNIICGGLNSKLAARPEKVSNALDLQEHSAEDAGNFMPGKLIFFCLFCAA